HRLALSVVGGAVVEAVAVVGGVPGVGADLGGRRRVGRAVRAVAVDVDRPLRHGGVVRLGQREGDRAGRAVAAAQRSAVAQHGQAHDVAGLAGTGTDGRAGLDGRHRLVLSVVAGPVVVAVAAVGGVPGVSADL